MARPAHSLGRQLVLAALAVAAVAATQPAPVLAWPEERIARREAMRRHQLELALHGVTLRRFLDGWRRILGPDAPPIVSIHAAVALDGPRLIAWHPTSGDAWQTLLRASRDCGGRATLTDDGIVIVPVDSLDDHPPMRHDVSALLATLPGPMSPEDRRDAVQGLRMIATRCHGEYAYFPADDAAVVVHGREVDQLWIRELFEDILTGGERSAPRDGEAELVRRARQPVVIDAGEYTLASLVAHLQGRTDVELQLSGSGPERQPLADRGPLIEVLHRALGTFGYVPALASDGIHIRHPSWTVPDDLRRVHRLAPATALEVAAELGAQPFAAGLDRVRWHDRLVVQAGLDVQAQVADWLRGRSQPEPATRDEGEYVEVDPSPEDSRDPVAFAATFLDAGAQPELDERLLDAALTWLPRDWREDEAFFAAVPLDEWLAQQRQPAFAAVAAGADAPGSDYDDTPTRHLRLLVRMTVRDRAAPAVVAAIARRSCPRDLGEHLLVHVWGEVALHEALGVVAGTDESAAEHIVQALDGIDPAPTRAALIAATEHASRDVRAVALRQLGRIAHPDATAAIARRLGDGDDAVRCVAFEVAAATADAARLIELHEVLQAERERRSNPFMIRDLVSAMRNAWERERDRWKAAAGIPDARAPAVAAALRDPAPATRILALHVLASDGAAAAAASPAMLGLLDATLAAERAALRDAWLAALESMDDDAPLVEALVAAGAAGSPARRELGILILKHASDATLAASLLAARDDARAAIATDALGNGSSGEYASTDDLAIARLQAALGAPGRARIGALAALAERGDLVRPLLPRLLADGTGSDAPLVAEAISAAGDEAIVACTAALRADDVAARRLAARALRRAIERPMGDDAPGAEAFRGDRELADLMRAFGRMSLGDLGKAAAPLLSATRDVDVEVRDEAAAAYVAAFAMDAARLPELTRLAGATSPTEVRARGLVGVAIGLAVSARAQQDDRAVADAVTAAEAALAAAEACDDAAVAAVAKLARAWLVAQARGR